MAMGMFDHIKQVPPKYSGHRKGRYITTTEGFLQHETGDHIDLHNMLTGHKHSIHLMPVHTNTMRNSGLHPGGYILVDTNIKPVKGSIVVVRYNDAIVVRRLIKPLTIWQLVADDPREEKLFLTEFAEYSLIGVVTFAINPCG
jgi:SOS-response transcriptional repressor LexA